MTVAVLAASAAAARLVTRIGTRPLLLAGAAAATGGLCWLSRLSEHGSYAGTVLGPTLVVSCGLGLLFVPLSLTALSRVRDSDSGAASSLLGAGQQVGGSIGLAVLGTAAWTVAADSTRTQAARAATMAARAGRSAEPGEPLPAAIYQHALAAGFGRALLAAAGIMLVALAIAVFRIPGRAPAPVPGSGTATRRHRRHRRHARHAARGGSWRPAAARRRTGRRRARC
jgi:hypothetical protein